MKIRVPLSIVGTKELADHLSTNHGLEVRYQDGKEKLLAKMAEAGIPTDFIEVDNGEAEPVVQRIEPAPKARHTPGKRMCQIQIEPQDKPGGNEPVWTAVNGVGIWITRGERVWVDYKYVHCLQNAKQTVPDKIGQDSEILSWRDVPEVPMSVWAIEPPLSKAEIAENEERERQAIAAREAAREQEAGMENAA